MSNEVDLAAFEEGKRRYLAEVHELRRQCELEAQAKDRALAARVVELDARSRELDAREAAVAIREAEVERVSSQLKQLLQG